eukprot:CAMPEP_0113871986 /NCGR_PEP_ID=MMETSP0780_2-20120614/2948_1 /TAXON_ID=652834 /ORGANISM="Palpitomonas bilix" /LENGTH=523 /DNA_ID=CAMNT_0000857439 /DNA_START=130 /DNA_END=1698 /DNA_ORIENTATION=- /assembly_acc=CAM_ASM_000599
MRQAAASARSILRYGARTMGRGHRAPPPSSALAMRGWRSAARLTAIAAPRLFSAQLGRNLASRLAPREVGAQKAEGLEIKDSDLIFHSVWEELAAELDCSQVEDAVSFCHGGTRLAFPYHVSFLAGAPGSGKGTHIPHIMNLQGISAPPICVNESVGGQTVVDTGSDLSVEERTASQQWGTGPSTHPDTDSIDEEAQYFVHPSRWIQVRVQGVLEGPQSDRELVKAVMKEMIKLKLAGHDKVLVSGFPLSTVQGECVTHLYDCLRGIRRRQVLTIQEESTERSLEFADSEEDMPMKKKPNFNLTVLFIDDEESVRRQLARGERVKAYNKIAVESGESERVLPIRHTDLQEDMARARYSLFTSKVFDSLRYLKHAMNTHWITAHGEVEEIQYAIEQSYAEQSGDISQDTYQMLNMIPHAAELTLHARQELVGRLDYYQARHSRLFREVKDCIEQEFVHILIRQGHSGRAVVRTVNPIFHEKLAADMALDILTERGYQPVLDVERRIVPTGYDKHTGDAQHNLKR